MCIRDSLGIVWMLLNQCLSQPHIGLDIVFILAEQFIINFNRFIFITHLKFSNSAEVLQHFVVRSTAVTA